MTSLPDYAADCGDYDGNGFLDLYITHFNKEWNTLYQNLGPFGFHDVTAATQLAVPTMDKLGWGTVMADFDQNGYDEVFAVNGHLDDLRAKDIDFEMTPQLFAYNGSTWDDCGAAAGVYFQRLQLGRGVASCDYDDDGDLEIRWPSGTIQKLPQVKPDQSLVVREMESEVVAQP